MGVAVGHNTRLSSFEGARALQLQPVSNQGGAGIEFEPHSLAPGIPTEVPIVEKPLKASCDLLIGAADQSSDVPSFEVAVAVDTFKDLDVARGQHESPVAFCVAVGLWDELPEALGPCGRDWHGVRF
jgi:hypothetical protein